MQELQEFLVSEEAIRWARAIVVFTLGMIAARLLSTMTFHWLSALTSEHSAKTWRRIVLYSLILVVVMASLHELGFGLGVLLGAAGVFSVAVGFASQTSASNLISGIFLVGEKAFMVGDIIRVGNTTGEVLAIDLLSVKLRTFDNLFVRLPNETLIKSEIVNLTRFPIRRVDLKIGVAYKEDIERVRDLLVEVADDHPLCLDQPRPVIIFQGFGDSSLNLQFSVWALRANYMTLSNTLPEHIKRAFDAHGVEIPFPHRTLYTGTQTEPFPIQLVSAPEGRRAD